MKRIMLATVAGVALMAAAPAMAADLAVKAPRIAPVAPPPPAFSWTGCFIGAHWGWGFGRADAHESFNVSTTDGGTHTPFTVAASDRIDTSGAIFGGQVGCDYQFGLGKGFGPGGWVIGIQGDLAGADINGFGTNPLVTDIIPVLTPFARIGVKDDAIGSVTARLGFSAWPQTLFYVRGGVAWLHERWDLHGTFHALTGIDEVDDTRSGWTIGVGGEWAFAPNWSAFVEWNHYDFGNHDVITSGRTFFCEFVVSDTFSEKQRIETIKIGVNYRFNWLLGKGKAPVVARY